MVLWFAALAAAGLSEIVAHPGVVRGLRRPTRCCSWSPTRSRVRGDGRDRAGHHRRRGAVRRHGPLRPSPIQRAWFFVVFPALTLNYLGQARADPAPPGSAVAPVLPAAAELGPAADGGAGDRGNRDRQPGRDLRRLLAVPAGDAARPAAAADGPPDLRARGRPDLPAGGQRGPVRRRAGGHAHVPFVGSGSRRRTACPSPARSSSTPAAAARRARAVEVAALEAGARRRGLRRGRGHLPGGEPVQGRARRVAAPARRGWASSPSWPPGGADGRSCPRTGARRRDRCGRSSRRCEQRASRGCPAPPSSPTRGRTPLPWPCVPTSSTTTSCTRRVIIVSASTANVPHVPASEAFTLDDLGYDDDGIQHLSVRYGFSDEPDLPAGTAAGVRRRRPGAPASPTSATRRTSCREGPSAGRRHRGWPGGARRCSSSSRTTPPTPLPTSPSPGTAPCSWEATWTSRTDPPQSPAVAGVPGGTMRPCPTR